MFRPKHRPAGDPAPAHQQGSSHKSWLRREDDAVTQGHSSLFFLGNDTPPPPSVTCIQGHEVSAGETTCHLGHPVG